MKTTNSDVAKVASSGLEAIESGTDQNTGANNTIGHELKAIRGEKNLSIHQLATMIGADARLIKALENDEISYVASARVRDLEPIVDFVNLYRKHLSDRELTEAIRSIIKRCGSYGPSVSSTSTVRFDV